MTSRLADLAPTSEREALTAFLDKQQDILVRKRTIPGDWPEGRSKISTDFEVGPDDSVLQWLAFYADQVAESRRIVAAADLEARCAMPGMQDRNLRWVLLHHIEEVARHAGHADIIRETIDGSTGR